MAPDFGERFSIEVTCTAEPLVFSPAAWFVVYRMVQEAITNITKYAQAKHAAITMNVAEGMPSVGLIDSGRGFNTTAIERSGLDYSRVGMRYGVAALPLLAAF